MVRETSLSVNDLIYPMFVVHGKNIKKEISSLPGNYHLSVDRLVDDVKEVHALGIPAVLFFGLPEKKDEMASEAYSPDGIVPKAIRAVKEDVPEILVIGDVCLCEYTDHGHCGIINNGCVDNDASLELVSKMTLTFAQAGADMVAPSCMMDGQISTMRATLDENGYQDTCIMSYSSKFASKLYDPFFKHGTQSVVAFGDKKSYQMDIANSEEAMREIALDIEEGADIVMVKPGMYYLDIVYRAKQEFGMPLAVYNVSGEYTMIQSAAEMGRIDEQAVMLEVLTSLKRAGADLILTYFAKDVARELNNGNRY
jgi:porphobilinogen synthase